MIVSPVQSPVQSAVQPAVLPESGGGSSLTTVFSDTFTGTNGTLLTAHTPDVDTVGTGWEFLSRSYELENNRANGNLTFARAVADTAEADVEITVDVRLNGATSSHNNAILARVVNDASRWSLGLSGDGVIEIAERTGGTFTVRAQTSLAGGAITPGQSYPLKATLSGDDLTLEFVDTGETVSFNSSSHNTATKHGLSSYITTGDSTFDNFEVKA